jgi:uncharacterized protein
VQYQSRKHHAAVFYICRAHCYGYILLMSAPVHGTRDMIKGMSPILVDGSFVFGTTRDASLAAQCRAKAIGMLIETEGESFILRAEDAEALGFDCSLRLRQITLRVHSSLTGVGLTAAVSATLAQLQIPSNIVAAFHHDHVFVPEALAEKALRALMDLQEGYDSR